MKTILRLIALSTLLAAYAQGAEIAAVKVTCDGDIRIKKVEPNLAYLSNRKYIFDSIPKELRSLDFTVIPGGAHKSIKATIPAGSLIYVCIDSGKNAPRDADLEAYQAKLRSDRWTYFGTIPTSDWRMQFLRVYKKEFPDATTVEFPGVGFTGALIAASRIEVETAPGATTDISTSSRIGTIDGIAVTPDVIGTPIVELLEQKAAERATVAPGDPSSQSKISPEAVAAILREWTTLQPGTSTRADVLKVFSVTGGGVGDATMRTYGYRDCPYILVDVTFKVSPATQAQFKNLSPRDSMRLAWEGGPTDKLISISKPYLGVLAMD